MARNRFGSLADDKQSKGVKTPKNDVDRTVHFSVRCPENLYKQFRTSLVDFEFEDRNANHEETNYRKPSANGILVGAIEMALKDPELLKQMWEKGKLLT